MQLHVRGLNRNWGNVHSTGVVWVVLRIIPIWVKIKETSKICVFRPTVSCMNLAYRLAAITGATLLAPSHLCQVTSTDLKMGYPFFKWAADLTKWASICLEVPALAARVTYRILPCPVSLHYCGVIMCAMASQITSLTIVYSIVHLGEDQRKHQNPTSLACVRIIYWLPWIPRTNGR